MEYEVNAGGFEAAIRNGDGGHHITVSPELDAKIDAILEAISPIRSISNVVKVGTSGYRRAVMEEANRLREIAPPSGELYANPAASQAMLDDAAFDVEGWLADEIAREFAVAEGAAFVNGNGTNKPKGFLASPTATTTDATRAFGTLQYVASGAAGAFAANPEEKLIDLIQTLRAPYRQGASWVMNSATLAKIRKFKSTDGQMLWQPGLAAGQPATLLGYPVVEAEDMPDIAANSLSIAFGNFRAGYLIVERETQLIRDPNSKKPYVHFYANRRIGGAVADSEAIKLLKFSPA